MKNNAAKKKWKPAKPILFCRFVMFTPVPNLDGTYVEWFSVYWSHVMTVKGASNWAHFALICCICGVYFAQCVLFLKGCWVSFEPALNHCLKSDLGQFGVRWRNNRTGQKQNWVWWCPNIGYIGSKGVQHGPDAIPKYAQIAQYRLHLGSTYVKYCPKSNKWAPIGQKQAHNRNSKRILDLCRVYVYK